MLKIEREMAKKMSIKNLNDDETVVLISYVQSKICLWNENHKDFKKVSITRKFWNEIGTQLNITGDEAKCKWKRLRDKSKKLLRKNSDESRGSESFPATPSWKFYNSMLFLKDPVSFESVNSTTPMASSNAPKESTVKGQEEENDDDFEEYNFDFLLPNNPDKDSSGRKAGPRSSKRKIKSNGEVDEKSQESEKKKFLLHPTIHQDERNGNDDHLFLISLMPYIQALEPVEKLELRSQMQNLVTASFKKHESNKYSRVYH